MGNSRCGRPLGSDWKLRLDLDSLAARTPGVLGRLDACDPNGLAQLGNTPGVLGIGDHGDPLTQHISLIPPLNYADSIEYQVFETMVLAEHIKRAERRRPRAVEIPKGELEEVEGGHELRKAAAIKCRALLKQARTDLENEKAAFLKKPKNEQEADERKMKETGQVSVVNVARFGITSGYRSIAHDSALWHSYFRKKYYPITYIERAKFSCFEGGRHGWKAVPWMVKFVGKRKAAPGFSNHSHGIAVDFYTVEGGKTLQAETGQSNEAMKKLNARWEKSWLYNWLQKHKTEYSIERIKTEAWHWEFRL